MLSETGTVRCTVADVDMVGYSDVARMLEENTNAGSVGELNRQIQGFITSAVNQLKTPEATRILAFTGDGAILLFERAEDAHVFGCCFQQAARQYSAQRYVPSAKRRFRIGLATGEVNLFDGGKQGDQYAGIAIANAVRLQTAAGPSEMLIDFATVAELAPSSQQQYAQAEEVRGKRDEVFRAHRCAIKLHDASTHLDESGGGFWKGLLSRTQGTPWWKRRITISLTVGLAAVLLLVALPSSLKKNNQETASVAPPNVAKQANPDAFQQIAEMPPAPVPALPHHHAEAAPLANGMQVAVPANPGPRSDANNVVAALRPYPIANGIPSQSIAATKAPDPSEIDSINLIGTWEIASGEKGAAEAALLELHADGTYKKTLNANVANPQGTSKTFDATRSGRWKSRGTIVYLSGDGSSPDYPQDLSKARKLK